MNTKVAGSSSLLNFLRLSGGTLTGALLLPDGTSGAPALAFASEPTLGIFRVSANKLKLMGKLEVSAGIQYLGDNILITTAAGKLLLENSGATVGVVFDVTTDGTLKIRNRGDTSDANIGCNDIACNSGTITSLGTAGGSVKEVRLASVAIDTDQDTAFTKQTIYTVPAGKSLIVTKFVLHTGATALTGDGVYGVGCDANATNYLSAQGLNATTANSVEIVQPPVAAGRGPYVAGDVFGLKLTTDDTTNTNITFDLFGYLV